MSEAPQHLGESGLQAERTALAWTRTSLALLANGALLMLRDFQSFPEGVGVAAVGLAGMVALAAFAIGRRRQRVLSLRPLPGQLTPTLEIYLLGCSVLILIVVSLITVTR